MLPRSPSFSLRANGEGRNRRTRRPLDERDLPRLSPPFPCAKRTDKSRTQSFARPSQCVHHHRVYSFTSTTTTALQAEKSERSSAATRTALLCSPLARTYEQSQRIRSSSSRGNSVRGHTVQSADIHIHTCMEERGTTHTRSTTDKVPQDSHMCTKKKKGRE